MKKILFILTYLFSSLAVFSQGEYNPCYDPDWDWTQNENWVVYSPENLLPDGTYLGVENTPFYGPELHRDFSIILDNNDLDPADGWVLLQKNLGCETYATAKPYVIFYNYYRGLIRVIAYHTFLESSSYGLLTAEWGGAKRSSALTYSNIYSRANEEYPAYDNDKVLLQMENYTNNQWFVGDFQVAFDHQTTSNQSGYYLDIKIYNVITSDIQLNSKVDLVTKSIEIKADKEKKEGNLISGTREWAMEGQKAIQKLNYDEWDQYLEDTKEGILEVYDWSRGQWLENNTFEWLEQASAYSYNVVNNDKFADLLSSGADALGAVNATLGFMVDVIDFFVGKPSKSSSPSVVQLAPTQITGTIVSEGKITTTTKQSTYSLPLPGTNSTAYPYYTCPLGVVNLKSTPTVNLRKWTESKTKYGFFSEKLCYSIDWEGFGWWDCEECPGELMEETEYDALIYHSQGSRIEQWKSIQLKNNLEISINAASNLELVSAQVALQAKIKGAQANPENPAYNFTEKYQLLPIDFPSYKILNHDSWLICVNEWGALSPYSVQPIDNLLYNRWINKTFDYCNNKTYLLLEGGEELSDGTRNGFYKFRTGFVDISEARNLSITVREETDITLKVIAVFKVVGDDDAPLMVFSNEYVINEPGSESDNVNAPYPFLRNQLEKVDIYPGSSDLTTITNKTLPFGTYRNKQITTQGNVNLNTNIPFILTANNNVTLKPGFTVKGAGIHFFKANIENGSSIIDPISTPMSQIAKYVKDGVEYYNPIACNCEPTPLQGKLPPKFKASQTITETHFEIAPNPFYDYIAIDYLSDNKLTTISIIDISGKKVYEKKISSGYHEIDLSHLNRGVYYLRLLDGTNPQVNKIIKY